VQILHNALPLLATHLIVLTMLTTAEVAKLINVSPNTVRYWRHVGLGPTAYKISHKVVRYRLEDVQSWLEATRSR